MSRAAAALREAETSECPHCHRMSKTTSDGICADCWGSKGGRPMQWQERPSRLGVVDDLLDFLPFWSRL